MLIVVVLLGVAERSGATRLLSHEHQPLAQQSTSGGGIYVDTIMIIVVWYETTIVSVSIWYIWSMLLLSIVWLARSLSVVTPVHYVVCSRAVVDGDYFINALTTMMHMYKY